MYNTWILLDTAEFGHCPSAPLSMGFSVCLKSPSLFFLLLLFSKIADPFSGRGVGGTLGCTGDAGVGTCPSCLAQPQQTLYLSVLSSRYFKWHKEAIIPVGNPAHLL